MRKTLKTFGSVAALGAATLTMTDSIAFGQSVVKDSANVTMFGADAAFTLPKGDMYFGATLSDPRGGVSGKGTDGDMSMGIGFGNPITSLGFELDLNVTELEPFGDSGNFTLKTSRALLMRPNHVIFGSAAVSNLAAWGDSNVGNERWNATISGLTQFEGADLIHPFMWTVGYGSDAVLSTAGSSLTEEGWFAGVGIGVTETFGMSVSATENQYNVGVGVRVPGIEGLNVSYGVNDITDHMDRKQQMLTLTYSLNDVFGGF
ncbi:hypothetical protein JMM61_16175 [Rhodovulum sulfidophilum]|uniref:hypothetical protein n=1 Tax=Rhodovulum sulfidophilum TaxID=35806 RepID=UPI001924D4E6|nr:hypothetical protein [Rhodovulum sulfidophilum]MBL3566753.1 hypothetical protein [Rhodovulum sulfidophilum]MBL3586906.1 hypothetical protein [Rhodovulum sulfidophilum]